MKITKIDLLYCDPVEGGWRPSLCNIYTDREFMEMEKWHYLMEALQAALPC